jgi:hypothetical protein
MNTLNERLARVIKEQVAFFAEGGAHGISLNARTTARGFAAYLGSIILSVNDLVSEDPSLSEGVSYNERTDAIKVALLNYWFEHADLN